jgi:hypothetical protein
MVSWKPWTKFYGAAREHREKPAQAFWSGELISGKDYYEQG